MSDRLILSLAHDGRDVPALRAAAESFTRTRGASSAESDAVAAAATDIAQWVSRTCFPAPATGVITVTLLAAEDGVQVTVADDGIPQAPFGSGLGDVPEDLRDLDQQVIDLHRVNLGTAGKQVRCLVPTLRLLEVAVHDEPGQISASPDDVDSRLARPEDAEAVGRVIHAVYGLNYGHDEFYDRDRLVAAWEGGDVISAVATVRGEVVAHMALFREPGGQVFEMGAAAVDPRFRSLGLTRAMGGTLGAEAFARKVPAISAHMVTTHTRTQSAPAQLGFIATGLLVGAAPAQEQGGPRQTLLLAYLPLQRTPRPIAMPSDPTYVAALTPVYAQLGLDLVPQDPAAALAEAGAAPGVELAPHSGGNSPAVIQIRRYGPDEHAALIDALRDAVTSGAAMIYVDLDLHTLAEGEIDAVREFLSYYDFFASGLLLYGSFGHDHLRMQSMLSRDLQLDDMVLLTDEARLVRAAVFQDHSKLAERIPQEETT